MSRISTFSRGGVHPADKKELSKNSPIRRIDLPLELIVSMSQHLGAPATPLKKKGDEVVMGEKIGQASSFISADVHSPVSGSVTEVRKVRLASGAVADALVIKCADIQPQMFTLRYDWRSQSSAELLSIIKDMGIVGMGGAAFPAHVKLSIPPDKKAEYLVINGVECEPYLTSDYRSMMERGKETLEGIMIAASIIGAKHICIGIELNKKDAIAHLEALIAEEKLPIEVYGLKMKYPQGDEKQLLKAVINREIPSGKLPIDVGAVVCNIGTCFAIYEACVFHKPLIERVITVSGEAVEEPVNLLAPIGTKASDLLKIAKCNEEEADRLISGGPMMGFAFADEDVPITKGSSGLLALKKVSLDSGVCVSCSKCVQHCPMGLMPNRMFRNIKYGRYSEAMELGLMDCKECGCCAFICPARLPLVQGFRLGKKMGRKKA